MTGAAGSHGLRLGRVVRVALALAAARLAARPARAQQVDSTHEPTPYEQLQLFSSVVNQIRANYLDSVTYRQLVHAAIDGMLRALDPHSTFMSRQEWERLDEMERGELPGVGLELEQEDSVITVLGVIPGSPAAKAGVQPGDRVVAVNDTIVAGLKAPDVAQRLAGPTGSKVGLRLERGSRLEPAAVTVLLSRELVRPPPVSVSGMAAPTTGYAWLAWFGPRSADELRKVVRQLERRGATRLILDLRDNPGGLVVAAVDVASLFLRRGAVVFRTKGRKAEADTAFVTPDDGAFVDLPLVVLINEHSASAAEALAGSLQDHDRALIVGRRSFGKALVQTAFLLRPADDMVMLTVARVFTPSGRVIQRHYRGVGYRQYLSFAGKSGAADDTLAVFKTDHGREVRGGGGIVPDVALSARPELPAWWSSAVESGVDVAVADSVAATLPATPASREQWMTRPGRWSAELLEPFLAHVASRLQVRPQPDSALAARLALNLAIRAATVRWPPDGGVELGIRNDPAIRGALAAFARAPSLLGTPH